MMSRAYVGASSGIGLTTTYILNSALAIHSNALVVLAVTQHNIHCSPCGSHTTQHILQPLWCWQSHNTTYTAALVTVTHHILQPLWQSDNTTYTAALVAVTQHNIYCSPCGAGSHTAQHILQPLWCWLSDTAALVVLAVTQQNIYCSRCGAGCHTTKHILQPLWCWQSHNKTYTAALVVLAVTQQTIYCSPARSTSCSGRKSGQITPL